MVQAVIVVAKEGFRIEHAETVRQGCQCSWFEIMRQFEALHPTTGRVMLYAETSRSRYADTRIVVAAQSSDVSATVMHVNEALRGSNVRQGSELRGRENCRTKTVDGEIRSYFWPLFQIARVQYKALVFVVVLVVGVMRLARLSLVIGFLH